MARSIIETRRVLFTWGFVLALLVLILISGSHWVLNRQFVGLLLLIGAVLVGFGVVGRLWCALHISGYKTYTLVKTGPYSVSRNPLYFFSLLGTVGVGLATGTITIPLLMAIFFALYYPAVIRAEESRLVEMHGEVFESYRAVTPAFWPRWSLLNEPEEYTVQPRVYRRSMRESIWFIWFFGALALVQMLHEAGWLPTLIRLY